MRARPRLGVVVAFAALAVVTVAARGFEPAPASLVSVGVLVYVTVYSYLRVGDGAGTDAGVGPGDAVTFVRLTLVAYVAGFVVVRPVGAETWLAAGAFAAAALLDAVDGAVARRTRQTELGSRLDAEADGLLTLVGVSVGVAHGWLPVVYIVVGVARYVFVVGVVVRRRLGMRVAELDESTTRKLLSSAQLAVVLGALVPVVPASVVRPAAVVAMIPFVVWFARDWLVVCGRVLSQV